MTLLEERFFLQECLSEGWWWWRSWRKTEEDGQKERHVPPLDTPRFRNSQLPNLNCSLYPFGLVTPVRGWKSTGTPRDLNHFCQFNCDRFHPIFLDRAPGNRREKCKVAPSAEIIIIKGERTNIKKPPCCRRRHRKRKYKETTLLINSAEIIIRKRANKRNHHRLLPLPPSLTALRLPHLYSPSPPCPLLLLIRISIQPVLAQLPSAQKPLVPRMHIGRLFVLSLNPGGPRRLLILIFSSTDMVRPT